MHLATESGLSQLDKKSRSRPTRVHNEVCALVSNAMSTPRPLCIQCGQCGGQAWSRLECHPVSRFTQDKWTSLPDLVTSFTNVGLLGAVLRTKTRQLHLRHHLYVICFSSQK
jgi:hypothetical protein